MGWLLGQELEDFIYEDVVTYEGCQKVMDRQEKVLRLKYNRHMNDYLDSIRRYRVKCPDDARPFKEFPPFSTWLGRRLPSGQALQMRIEKAYYLPGSGGDLLSRHNYRRMQIQQVTTVQPNEEGLGDTSIASDHTFAAGKAYHAPGDTLKIWDMTSGWYKTLTAVVVKTTKSAEILQATLRSY